MTQCSAFLNSKSSGLVQLSRNASRRVVPYIPIMLDWFLADWLKSLSVSQADLVRLTDYPKAKVSDLVTGKQRYNRDVLNDIALALNLQPHELLLHPDDAMALRRFKIAAETIVRVPFGGTAGDEAAPGPTIRKAS